MSYATARDVAAEFRRRDRRASDLKVHKLLYLVQGFHLAWTGRPLFREQIQAWTDGPVVADLWRDEHQRGMYGPPTRELTAGELSIFNHVYSRFGSMTGAELRDLTHREGPWCDVWGERGPTDRGTDEIMTWQMRDWFQQDAELRALRSEAERTSTRWRELVLAESSPGLATSLERVLKGEDLAENHPF